MSLAFLQAELVAKYLGDKKFDWQGYERELRPSLDHYLTTTRLALNLARMAWLRKMIFYFLRPQGLAFALNRSVDLVGTD